MKKIIMYSAISLCLFNITSCTSNNELTLDGDIQNNVIASSSIVSGRIVEMKKNQGEIVKKGDIIAVIDNCDKKYAVDAMQAVVDMKKSKLDELKAGNRPEQIAQAEAQVRASKANLDQLLSGNRDEQIEQAKNSVYIAEDSFNTAQSTYDNIKNQYDNASVLYKSGAISKSEFDDISLKFDTATNQRSSAEFNVENAKQQLKLLQDGSTIQSIDAARANYDAANAQLELIKNGYTKQTIDAAEADLNQAVAQLSSAQNSLNNCNITALDDGVIISKNYSLGDTVNIGCDVADIGVSNDVYVLCYIPDKYLDKISYGENLNVIVNDKTITGTISYIDLNHEYTPKDKQSSADKKHSSTKIKVKIDSENGKYKSGMTAKVEIQLSK